MSEPKVVESPPRFVKRNGDTVVEGANNTLIVLGTDRASDGPASPADGLGTTRSPGGGKDAGSIHAVVGRHSESGDPDFSKDSAFSYLSMKTDVDNNLSIKVGETSGPVAAAVLKSDSVRVVGRKDIKIILQTGDGDVGYLIIGDSSLTLNLGNSSIVMKDGEVIVKSLKIKIGDGAQESLVLGDSFIRDVIQHKHPSAVGPTGPALFSDPTGQSYLSKKHKVE